MVVIGVYYLLKEIVAAHGGSPEKAQYFTSCFLELGRVSSVYRCQRCVGCQGVVERGVP